MKSRNSLIRLIPILGAGLALLASTAPARADDAADLYQLPAGSSFTLTLQPKLIDAQVGAVELGAVVLEDGTPIDCTIDFPSENVDRQFPGGQLSIQVNDVRDVVDYAFDGKSQLNDKPAEIWLHCNNEPALTIGQFRQYVTAKGGAFVVPPPAPF